MLHTKFQASKPSGSEVDDVLIFFYVFLWLEPMTPGQRPSWTLGPFIRKNLVEDYQAMLHTKFQTSGPCGSEEEGFWIDYNAFLWFKPRTPWHRAIWDPGILVWTNLVKDHQAMLHTKFQAPEPSSSGEEDFEVYFIFEPKTPRRRAISDPRATIWTNLVEVY